MRRPRVQAIRALRALAAWIALVLVGAQLSSIGHHVLVAHYLCSEHGTLHHGEAPEARASARANVESAAPAPDADHGAHDDCTAPVRTPAEAVIAEPPVTQLEASRAAVELSPVALAQAHAALPLLSLAPKQGPPRA
ncbi:MAG: hypothetical protein L6Q84_26470 [Polyangiaceae bacterium]|nr:hypothetical protein [Polyangiaceae bacterium]